MAALAYPAPSPYGLKAIREMKGSKSQNNQPTERLKKKVMDTQNYFYEKVDPLVGECITYLLCEQPTDISQSMLDFFQKKSRGEKILRKDPNKQHENVDRKAKKELKLLLATSIGPVVAKLINRIAVKQPENVVDFMCTEMMVIMEENGDVIHQVYEDEPVDTYPIMSAPLSTKKFPSESKDNQEELKPLVSSVQTSVAEVKSLPEEKVNEIKSDVVEEEYKEPKNLQISVIGVGNAGKSTILNLIEGKVGVKTRPTLGFRPVSMMLGEDYKIRFYDLGGGKKIREIWEQYYHDVHGVIYVVDASSSKEEVEESAASFAAAFSNPYLEGKPLLILANKQDKTGAMSGEDVRLALKVDDVLKLKECHDIKSRLSVMECSAFVPEDFEENDFTPDERIEAGLDSLLTNIMAQYDALNVKVEKDSASKAAKDEIKRAEKERYVLKCKIAGTFPKLIEPSILDSLNIVMDPESIFTEEEGVTFLAAEIGEEAANLEPLALKIAAAVGYQRLALQIIGAMKAPINKKKIAMTWEQIDKVVMALRSELGLPVQ